MLRNRVLVSKYWEGRHWGLGFVEGEENGGAGGGFGLRCGRNGDDEVDGNGNGNGNEAYKKIKQREESWLSTWLRNDVWGEEENWVNSVGFFFFPEATLKRIEIGCLP